MDGTYSQMRRKVLQAERSVLAGAGWHLRERLGAPDALALARTQQDASPEDYDLATPRDAGCNEDVDGVLPRSGGGGGQKAAGDGAGAKELMLLRWTKNSLFLRKSVELIAWREHRSNRKATTPAQPQQREQMAAAHRQRHSRAGCCTSLFGWGSTRRPR